jgi:uncharacterized protein involved in cysteine biosynthesis
MLNARRYLDPAPAPPAGEPGQRVLYGLMQPILAVRLLLRRRDLLRAALVPVALVAAFCALWGLLEIRHGPARAVRVFYRTFAVLAPLPSVLMAGHYARLVVRARACLDFPPAEPYVEPLGRRLRNAIFQALLIAMAIAPATFLLDMLPLLGKPLVRVAAAVWALHWIVVDAFDASRVRRPGEPTRDEADADARQPWFVRGLLRAAEPIPIVGGLMRRFARFCDRLAHPWREEIAVVEDHPLVMLGFGITTAALLATPVLNLFFRPIVLVGAVHVLGQVEAAAAPPPLTGPSPTVSLVS